MPRTAQWHQRKAQQLDLLRVLSTGYEQDECSSSVHARIRAAEAKISSLEKALTEARRLQALAEFALIAHKNLSNYGGGADEILVRELLTIAHPDKWSQGQPATELAHELSVRLTKTSRKRC